MDVIRTLAREAAGFEEVQMRPDDEPVHRSGFVDVERHPWDWADDDPAPFHEARPRTSAPKPWRHQWNPIEADVTPWMSPEELDAAAEPYEGVVESSAARPFTPTHTYTSATPDPHGHFDEPEHYEFMVLGDSAYVQESWERGAPPDFHIAPDGSWWHRTAGCLFDPEDAPLPVPRVATHAQDEGEHTPAGEPVHVEVPEGGDQPPGDREHLDYIRAAEENRLDALEARREVDGAARERAAEALDRLADTGGDGAVARAVEPVIDDESDTAGRRTDTRHITPFEAADEADSYVENDAVMELE